ICPSDVRAATLLDDQPIARRGALLLAGLGIGAVPVVRRECRRRERFHARARTLLTCIQLADETTASFDSLGGRYRRTTKSRRRICRSKPGPGIARNPHGHPRRLFSPG